MIPINYTIRNDNQVIVFIKVYLDNTTIKICSREDNYILGYTNILSEDCEIVINSQVDSHDKGLLLNDSIELRIPRFIKNNYFSAFQNSFYPATNKPHFYNRKVEIGIGWEGMTNESHITWIYKGEIEAVNYNPTDIVLSITNKITDIEVPTETFNSNEYPNIPEENIGKVKPIVFGYLNYSFLYYDDGNINNVLHNYHFLAPAILVDKVIGKFFISQHYSILIPNDMKLNNGNSYTNKNHIIRYEQEPDFAIAYYNDYYTNGAIVTNNSNEYSIQLLADGNVSNNLKANFKYKPKSIGHFKANYSEKLLEKTAGSEGYLIPTNNYFSYDTNKLDNNIVGFLDNSKMYLVIHSGGGTYNLDVSVFNKTTNSIEFLTLVSTTYPKTFISTNFADKFNGNYEIAFKLLVSTLISNFYFIGFNLNVYLTFMSD